MQPIYPGEICQTMCAKGLGGLSNSQQVLRASSISLQRLWLSLADVNFVPIFVVKLQLVSKGAIMLIRADRKMGHWLYAFFVFWSCLNLLSFISFPLKRKSHPAGTV